MTLSVASIFLAHLNQFSTPTMSNPNALVQKLWNYCNILRDDGLSYGDYVEQLTFLLFLKMADEQTKPPFNKTSPVPKGFGWDALQKPEQRPPVEHNFCRQGVTT